MTIVSGLDLWHKRVIFYRHGYVRAHACTWQPGSICILCPHGFWWHETVAAGSVGRCTLARHLNRAGFVQRSDCRYWRAIWIARQYILLPPLPLRIASQRCDAFGVTKGTPCTHYDTYTCACDLIACINGDPKHLSWSYFIDLSNPEISSLQIGYKSKSRTCSRKCLQIKN